MKKITITISTVLLGSLLNADIKNEHDKNKEANFFALRISLSEKEKKDFVRKSTFWEWEEKAEHVTQWNDGESFPSVGIGHYIWYPEYENPKDIPPYEESFPDLIRDLVELCYQGQKMPDDFVKLLKFLNYQPKTGKINKAPWKTRDDFYKNYNDDNLILLRAFLNRPEVQICQVDFQIKRLNKTLGKITAKENNTHAALSAYLHKLAASPGGTAALVDYINFKGDGLDPKEAVLNPSTKEVVRWGLLQVLQNVSPKDLESNQPLAVFKESATRTLANRVRVQPEVAKWMPNWADRIDKYGSMKEVPDSWQIQLK